MNPGCVIPYNGGKIMFQSPNKYRLIMNINEPNGYTEKICISCSNLHTPPVVKSYDNWSITQYKSCSTQILEAITQTSFVKYYDPVNEY